MLVRNLQPAPVDENRLVEVAEISLELEHFDKPAEISIVLTDDRRIRVLNREYRGKDCSTDVLAFSQLEGEGFSLGDGEAASLGDVVISVETARGQADERGHDLGDELDLLVAHGVLHLLGHDDETDSAAADMRRREAKIMDRLQHGRTRQTD